MAEKVKMRPKKEKSTSKDDPKRNSLVKRWLKHLSTTYAKYNSEGGAKRSASMRPTSTVTASPSADIVSLAAASAGDDVLDPAFGAAPHHHTRRNTEPLMPKSLSADSMPSRTSPRPDREPSPLPATQPETETEEDEEEEGVRAVEAEEGGAQLIPPNEVKVVAGSSEGVEQAVGIKERLANQDAIVQRAMAEKVRLLSQHLNVPLTDFDTIAEMSSEEPAKREAGHILLAAIHQSNRLTQLVNNSLSARRVPDPGRGEGGTEERAASMLAINQKELASIASSLNEQMRQLLVSIRESEEAYQRMAQRFNSLQDEVRMFRSMMPTSGSAQTAYNASKRSSGASDESGAPTPTASPSVQPVLAARAPQNLASPSATAAPNELHISESSDVGYASSRSPSSCPLSAASLGSEDKFSDKSSDKSSEAETDEEQDEHAQTLKNAATVGAVLTAQSAVEEQYVELEALDGLDAPDAGAPDSEEEAVSGSVAVGGGSERLEIVEERDEEAAVGAASVESQPQSAEEGVEGGERRERGATATTLATPNSGRRKHASGEAVPSPKLAESRRKHASGDSLTRKIANLSLDGEGEDGEGSAPTSDVTHIPFEAKCDSISSASGNESSNEDETDSSSVKDSENRLEHSANTDAYQTVTTIDKSQGVSQSADSCEQTSDPQPSVTHSTPPQVATVTPCVETIQAQTVCDTGDSTPHTSASEDTAKTDTTLTGPDNEASTPSEGGAEPATEEEQRTYAELAAEPCPDTAGDPEASPDTPQYSERPASPRDSSPPPRGTANMDCQTEDDPEVLAMCESYSEAYTEEGDAPEDGTQHTGNGESEEDEDDSQSPYEDAETNSDALDVENVHVSVDASSKNAGDLASKGQGHAGEGDGQLVDSSTDPMAEEGDEGEEGIDDATDAVNSSVNLTKGSHC